MSSADRLTASRLFLSPVFFIAFMWGEAIGFSSLVVAIFLVALFTVIEVSDLLDGIVARGSGTVSSFGKLFDPFADVFARVTYFVCFAWAGIMPLWMLLVVLYREFGILFMRMLLAQRGIAMGARPGGKVKAVFYMLSGAFSLLYWSIPRVGIELGPLDSWFRVAVLSCYSVAVLLSVWSFVDYWIHFRKALAGSS
jgi:CDP-diacylglycerol--glycerol-3-phosphate 3-phosphatidyltransferase